MNHIDILLRLFRMTDGGIGAVGIQLGVKQFEIADGCTPKMTKDTVMFCFTCLNSRFGFSDNRSFLLDSIHEPCIGDIQPIGNFPEGISCCLKTEDDYLEDATQS